MSEAALRAVVGALCGSLNLPQGEAFLAELDLTDDQRHYLRRARNLLWTAAEIETSWSYLYAASGMGPMHALARHRDRMEHARELAQRCLNTVYALSPGVIAAKKSRLRSVES